MAPPAILPTPDFTWNPDTNPPKAGLRPKRKGTYRLEPETHGDRFIVHNYGHAGAGITMSWGCALEVIDLVAVHNPAANQAVAVLGGGVMGLTAAVLLAERNLNVTIYATKFPPNTTSNVAGGQWAPASVEHHNNNTQFQRILRRSFAMHQAKGEAYGVSPRPNYSLHELTSFEDVPTDLVPRTHLAHLPFARLTRPGLRYDTMLVEPPIFLPKLLSDLDARQVPRITQTFGKLNDVLAQLSQKIIINCTGLGAGELCGDGQMQAVKGQLAMLPAQPTLQYLFSGDGYLFPRKDAVVIGGTEDTDFHDDQPDVERCKGLVANLKKLFDPSFLNMMTPAFVAEWMRPSWIMRGK